MVSVITCADDFGLAPEINRGIVKAHEEGILQSTALLVNAPSTFEALELAKQHPRLEIGLHLSFVEGYALTAHQSPSLLNEEQYFSGAPCLKRNWKIFLKDFYMGKISRKELKNELETQILFFLKYFDEIPFLNGTQHLHLLPGVRESIMELCLKYSIKALRVVHNRQECSRLTHKGLQASILAILSRPYKKNIKIKDRVVTDGTWGFSYGGNLNEDFLFGILEEIFETCQEDEIHEIMFHPGYDCPFLKSVLPKEYGQYYWDLELEALCSKNIRKWMTEKEIKLTTFKKAYNFKMNRGI